MKVGKTKEYSITIAMWDRVAQQYGEIFMDLDMYNTSYDVFCNAVKVSPAKILEIGCGRKYRQIYVIKKTGFQIKSFRCFSEHASVGKKKNIPDAAFILLDARNIYQLNENLMELFAVLYSISVYERCSAVFSDINRLFNDEGIFFISV